MGDEGFGGPCFSLLTPSVCGRYYGEQSCEIILNLDQWFMKCYLKDLLSGAMSALLFGGEEPFIQF